MLAARVKKERRMGKRKKPSAELYLIDLYQICVRVRPLFGLERLVRLAHRKRNGVLYCDNASSISEAITFSEKNTRTVLFSISHRRRAIREFTANRG